jgi:hypothetical protein
MHHRSRLVPRQVAGIHPQGIPSTTRPQSVRRIGRRQAVVANQAAWAWAGRAGGPPSIHIQDASHCLETSEFTATLTSANGTSGYFTARNVCGYHVIGVGCYRRLSGGQTCVNVGGPAGHIARITFAYAATPLNKIGMTWKVCRTDNAPPMACFESVQSFSRQHDDGKRP